MYFIIFFSQCFCKRFQYRAIEMIDDKNFDLVITDIVMEGLDGLKGYS